MKAFYILLLLFTLSNAENDPVCHDISRRGIVQKAQLEFKAFDKVIPKKDITLLVDYLSSLHNLKWKLKSHIRSTGLFRTIAATGSAGAAIATLVTDESWGNHAAANAALAGMWQGRLNEERMLLGIANEIIEMLISNTISWAASYKSLEADDKKIFSGRTRGYIDVVEVLTETVGRLGLRKSREAERKHMENILNNLKKFKDAVKGKEIHDETKMEVTDIFTQVLKCTGMSFLNNDL